MRHLETVGERAGQHGRRREDGSPTGHDTGVSQGMVYDSSPRQGRSMNALSQISFKSISSV